MTGRGLGRGARPAGGLPPSATGPPSRPPPPNRPPPPSRPPPPRASSTPVPQHERSTISSGTLHLSAGATSTSLASEPTKSIEQAAAKLSMRDEAPKQPVTFRGKSGKTLQVTSNYLRLKADSGSGVYEYDVKFEPNIDMRNERFRLLKQLEPVIGTVRTFDGSKLFLPVKMEARVCEATHSESGSPVKVHVNYKKKLELWDRDMIQQFNIIFKRIFGVLKFKMHNRNFYDPVAAHSIRQHNLTIWPGYVTAVDRYEGGILLQCDVSHRVLRTESVRDILIRLKQKSSSDIKTEAEKALLGVSVLTRYNNASYKIDDIDWTSTPESTFTNSKGETLSYIDYYKKQYGIDIMDKKQPMLVNRPKKKGLSEDQADRLVCLVPELCLMTGMTDAMRADFKVMKDVATITRLTPSARAKNVDNFINRVTSNPEAYKLLRDWGISLEPNALPVVARVLDPETLFFGKGKSELISGRGDWTRSATSSVLTPVDLKKWAIIFWDKNKLAVQTFCKTMQQAASRMGINVAGPKIVSLPDDRTDSYVKQLRSLLDPSVQLVLLVFPQLKADRYAAVKKLCCIEMPVPSQVVCLKTISNEKRLNAVAQKVILQINCKLGGELWGCRTPFRHLMVVGIDVFHDKSRKSGSIAGVVASINDSLSRYYSTVAIQKQGQEIIDALKVAFMQSLIRYFEANNHWPETVVVFRDGVSDSQMDTVAAYEGAQFVRTFQHVDKDESSGSSSDLYKKFSSMLPKDYSPQFAYIVVQKRISTRIMIKKGADFDNPPAGTVMDHTVTRFGFKDFFLVPQVVTQGTVTPTHMVVVHEHGAKTLDPDDVQKLAYKLTHMYFNWPGTVRVPAPCQYAHKLVDLVGEHLHNQPSQELSDKLYFL